jgi:outer membrane protein assembly factor BamE (lipoprotein component of BamABCDE complex)
MHDVRCFTLCLLFLALPGCSSEPTKPDIPLYVKAKAEMIGMSRDEVFTCLGPPVQKSAEGSVDTWDYNFDTCTIHLTIAGDGKVKAANDTIKTVKDKPWQDDPPPEEEQCAHVLEVTGCLQWLRHK